MNAYTYIILSCHPGGTQLLLDSRTGGCSFVLSGARTERSRPDGSVHHVFSLASLPQSVWLEPLSQQCALSSMKVMVHMNEWKRGSPWWFQPRSLRQTRSLKQITRIWGHMSDSTVPFLFITLTFCWNQAVVLLPSQTQATFNSRCSDPCQFVASNSTAELNQWREAKWLAWNGHSKIKTGQRGAVKCRERKE